MSPLLCKLTPPPLTGSPPHSMPQAMMGAEECRDTYTNIASFNGTGYIQLRENKKFTALKHLQKYYLNFSSSPQWIATILE